MNSSLFETMTFNQERGKEIVKNLYSEMVDNLLYVPAVLFVLFFFTGFSFKCVATWRMKQSPTKPANCIIFVGQLFLAIGLYWCFESMKLFHNDMLYSFIYFSISSYFFSASMFLSYDFRTPPNEILGFLLCIVGIVCTIVCWFCEYTKVWTDYTSVPSILGLHLFGIGASCLALNNLKREYEHSQFAYWELFMNSHETNF